METPYKLTKAQEKAYLKDPITSLSKFERASNDRFKWKIKNIESKDGEGEGYNYEITIKFGN